MIAFFPKFLIYQIQSVIAVNKIHSKLSHTRPSTIKPDLSYSLPLLVLIHKVVGKGVLIMSIWERIYCPISTYLGPLFSPTNKAYMVHSLREFFQIFLQLLRRE